MERPLTFRSNGEDLVATLSLPDGGPKTPDFGIVFAQSGARGRLGNTFHYPYFARRFAALGVPTFRFDPAGLGDSTGTIETGNMRDLYGKIAVGRFVGDTLAAIDEFGRHVQPKRLFLFGVCGGAVTALLTAPRSPKIDGLVLLSVPVLLDSAQMGTLGRIPKSYAREYLIKNYAKKLYSLNAWKRFLTGKSDMQRIFHYAKASLTPAKRTIVSASDPIDKHPHPLFNTHFLEAMDALTERRSRLLIMFGQEDYFRHEWEAEFYKIYWDRRPAYKRQIDLHYIPGCNHMFTLREWQKKAIGLSMEWLATF